MYIFIYDLYLNQKSNLGYSIHVSGVFHMVSLPLRYLGCTQKQDPTVYGKAFGDDKTPFSHLVRERSDRSSEN